ncbi:MAG: dihydrolipoyl dehydrogenase [Parachlamydiaceae bacterium]|nr:dihydrolipoyl dehydrogenase [Parachlamydiaceae bacterium]
MRMTYDVVVIGSGPGGYVAAVRAAQLGLKTACVEKEKTLGGTCLNVGCIPSKTLLYSSEQYHWAKEDSAVCGINCSDVSFDFKTMMERKESVVQGLVNGIGGLFKQNGVTHISGTARFSSSNRIEVTDGTKVQSIEARSFILATGSEPIALPFLPFDERIVVSSTGALSLKKVPKKMIVVGAGVIGVELASLYKRLGSEVTIVEMLPYICPPMDDAVRKNLLQVLKKQGITFLLSAKVTQAKVTSNSASITVEQEGKTVQLDADVVLVAIGRRPYSQGLGLQELGVKMEKGLVTVDGNFRTSVPNLYAIGDLIEGPMLAHKASEEGYAVAEILAGNRPHVNYLAIPNVIYTHPEVASVGLTEEEARKAGLEIVIGSAMFRGNARARCNGYTEGFVKVIGLKETGHLIGMHMVGPQVSEMINIGVVAIGQKTTLSEIASAPIGHPTLSETIKEACAKGTLSP